MPYPTETINQEELKAAIDKEKRRLATDKILPRKTSSESSDVSDSQSS
ncbi:MAG: hypothetical protein US63_C0026G0009 [Candidatus Moranbacteria bacterium GW2011_GWC2_37_8]|nr:MAG: hypothetical protein US63_C0026G0009 [Candidatus Moranbacteria bacterium GW2011_GWC2_37_8]KKQ62892.1 MAG: hypothetical protein US82_C0004G0009 [Parcubacteria group bacterium GW2011_GWC1_38_22]KKQ81478.1 MAG: hypothetical protein UT03_C0001G0018 [Candidatus Moranbacteria bacterium GW2011_GWD2_38_7]